MRATKTLLAALCLLHIPSALAEPNGRSVVELFTSQGCSSCPAADALLGEVANRPGVLALSFPVTYWDYLGWKDTLARPEFTDRQRAYAQQRRDRAVYTPQIVVNGREHVVGSDRDALQRALDRQKDQSLTPAVPLDVAVDTDVIRVHIPADVDTSRVATLWLVQYDRRDEVSIARGENRGRTVIYTNVVRQMQPIGMWRGQDMKIELPAKDLLRNPSQGVAVLLQVDAAGRPGPVLGAVEIADTSDY